MRRIIVVGGGIGGLIAAIGLSRTESEVLVLEQAGEFGEVGAGVQLGPNAMRVLARMGLGEEIRRAGVLPVAGRLSRWDDGRMLAGGPAAVAQARYGAPFCTMYRPDLIEVLASHVPSDIVRFNAHVVGVESGDRPRVRLADGTEETADIVIGADGAHSMVRAATIGEPRARFSGCSAYRALLPGDAIARPYGPMIRFWLGPERHVIGYHIGRNARYFNLVGIVPDPEATTIASSAEVSDAAVLRTHFADWSPEVRALFDVIDRPVLRTPLYDRLPLSQWSTATTTLMGDAAHAMLPFMAQGVGQAIEDAAALIHCLSDTSDEIAVALARYEMLRRPHTARVQRLAWKNNDTLHLADGPDQRARDAAMAKAEGGIIASLDWLYANEPAGTSAIPLPAYGLRGQDDRSDHAGKPT